MPSASSSTSTNVPPAKRFSPRSQGRVAAERLLAFAERHFVGVARFQDVRTEELAEAFRGQFGLVSFPRLNDLRTAVTGAGIVLDSLPDDAPMDGANTWGEGAPTIWLRRS